MQTAPTAPSDWTDDDVDDPSAGAWLYDKDSVPIVLPAAVDGFRIKYWPPGARGPGELQRDSARYNAPLFVLRTSGPEEFSALVKYKVGRYKLMAISASQQPVPNVPVALFELTDESVARLRGVEAPSAPIAPVPASTNGLEPNGVLDRVLSMLQEQQRANTEQMRHLVSSLAPILVAAGDSGVVAKTMTIAAAHAGASVVVAASGPGSAPSSVPADAAPRDAAPANADAKADAKKGDAEPEPDEDEEEKRSGASMMAEMFKPFAEKLAPVAAYSAAKAMKCSEEQARQFAGMAGGAASKGFDVLVGSKPAATSEAGTPGTESGSPLSGAALDAHVAAIRTRLSADEETLLRQIGLRHYPRYTELTTLVGAMSVDEGVETIRKVALIWCDLTETERSFLHRMIDDNGFKVLMHVADHDTVEAVRLVRCATAKEDTQGVSATAA